MAVDRVLTSAEKEQLVANQDFKNQVSWSLRDFAAYWSDVSDANVKVGNVGYDRWAKNYSWSARAAANITITDDALAPEYYGALLKGMQLWDTDDGAFDVATVIQYMVDNAKFEELATMYVTAKTPTMVF